MSDTEAKDIVQQFLSAIAAGDGATMLGLMADDAVMITPGSPKVPTGPGAKVGAQASFTAPARRPLLSPFS